MGIVCRLTTNSLICPNCALMRVRMQTQSPDFIPAAHAVAELPATPSATTRALTTHYDTHSLHACTPAVDSASSSTRAHATRTATRPRRDEEANASSAAVTTPANKRTPQKSLSSSSRDTVLTLRIHPEWPYTILRVQDVYGSVIFQIPCEVVNGYGRYHNIPDWTTGLQATTSSDGRRWLLAESARQRLFDNLPHISAPVTPELFIVKEYESFQTMEEVLGRESPR